MEKALPAIPAKRYFTIGEVGELCGVKPYVLRYWEQEFAQLKPMKRRGNRRYYQHHEVLLIRRIRDLLYDQGFTISGARNQLIDAVASGRVAGSFGIEDSEVGEGVHGPDASDGNRTTLADKAGGAAPASEDAQVAHNAADASYATHTSQASDALPPLQNAPRAQAMEVRALRAELVLIRDLLLGEA